MPSSSPQITEASNRAEICSLLLSKGYMVYHPEADVNGIDFLIETPAGLIQKCQLKSRAFVHWKKYGGENIHMVFPGVGEPMRREWYVVPHDKLFHTLKEIHGSAPKWDHPVYGEYWHAPVSKKLAERLALFAVKSPSYGAGVILRDNQLRADMFAIDAKHDWEKMHELGYSFPAYEYFPEEANTYILCAMLNRCKQDREFPDDLFSLRALLFIQLRSMYWAGTVEDGDYRFCGELLRKIRNQLS